MSSLKRLKTICLELFFRLKFTTNANFVKTLESSRKKNANLSFSVTGIALLLIACLCRFPRKCPFPWIHATDHGLRVFNMGQKNFGFKNMSVDECKNRPSHTPRHVTKLKYKTLIMSMLLHMNRGGHYPKKKSCRCRKKSNRDAYCIPMVLF